MKVETLHPSLSSDAAQLKTNQQQESARSNCYSTTARTPTASDSKGMTG
jgi:hypothetical protein